MMRWLTTPEGLRSDAASQYKRNTLSRPSSIVLKFHQILPVTIQSSGGYPRAIPGFGKGRELETPEGYR